MSDRLPVLWKLVLWCMGCVACACVFTAGSARADASGAWTALAADASCAPVAPSIRFSSDLSGPSCDNPSGSVVSVDLATQTASDDQSGGPGVAGTELTPDDQYAVFAEPGQAAVESIANGNTVDVPAGDSHDLGTVAIAPNGQSALLADPEGNELWLLTDIESGTPRIDTSAPIEVGMDPQGVAYSPDGKQALVTNADSGASGGGSVSIINTSTNTVTKTLSGLTDPNAVAVSPNGSDAYVVESGGVLVINLSTDTAGSTIALNPTLDLDAIAISPNGQTAWVADTSGGLSEVTGLGGTAPTAGVTLSTGATALSALSFAPDGQTLYVNAISTGNEAMLYTVDSASSASPSQGTPIDLDAGGTDASPEGLTVSPDQAPTANFTVGNGSAGSAVSFDGSSSTAPVGSIASYTWSFGDGTTQTTTSPTVTHTYSTAGADSATLTVTDTAGTSTTETYTGQTATNDGDAGATATKSLTITAASTNPSTPTPAPVAQLSTSSLSFPNTATSATSAVQSITLTNTGTANLSVGAVSLSGAEAADFTLAGNACANQSIAPQASCSVSVGFDPKAAGAAQATLGFTDNANGSPQTVALTGTASGPTAAGDGTGALYGVAGPTGTSITLYDADGLEAYQGFAGEADAYGPNGILRSLDGPDYEISGITPGTYRLVGASFASGDVNQVDEITIGANQVTQQNVVLTAGVPLTGGLTITGQASSVGGVDRVLVGQAFGLNVPIVAATNVKNVMEMETYTFTLGPDTSLAGESSTATEAVAVYVDANGAASFAAGAPFPTPKPTTKYGTWQLGQAAAGLSEDEPLNGAQLSPEIVPAISDGDTLNVSSGEDIQILGDDDPNCPPGTSLVEHNDREFAAKWDGWIQSNINDYQAQLDAPDSGLDSNERAKLENLIALNKDTIAQAGGNHLWDECVPDGQSPHGSVYVDPSGKVSSTKGIPVANAKVVLEHSATKTGHFTAPPKGSTLMSPSNRLNPDFASPLGLFGWNVAPGFYKVEASAAGCYVGTTKKDLTVSTKTFAVPPPVSDISLKLTCPKLTRAKPKLSLTHAAGSLAVHIAVTGKRHGTAYGTVAVKEAGKTLGSVILVRGRAVASVPRIGTVTAAYSGDGHYTPLKATLNLKKPKTKTR